MGIKPRTLSFTYKLPPAAPPSGGSSQTEAEAEVEVADALSSVLDGYAASGGPETFTVTKEDGVFHVVATNFLNKEGKLQQLTPILDTKITIQPKQRTRLGLFQAICQSLTKATGISVEEMDFPFNGGSLQAQATTTISGSDVTARSLLGMLLAEMAAPMSRDVVVQGPNGQRLTRDMVVDKGDPLSWKLFYSPGWGYTLHIRRLTAVGR
jgi:hypothetical protein